MGLTQREGGERLGERETERKKRDGWQREREREVERERERKGGRQREERERVFAPGINDVNDQSIAVDLHLPLPI